MLKIKQLIVIMLLAMLFSNSFNSYGRGAGEPGKIALEISGLIQNNAVFTDVNVFTAAPLQFNEQISATIRRYSLLQVNQAALKSILQSPPDFIRLTLPFSAVNPGMTLLLYKVNISGNGFILETSDGRSMKELNTNVHYRGIIQGDMNSVASFSFSLEECMGLISNDKGNFVTGEIENANGNDYVYYNDKDLIPPFTYSCGTNTSNPANAYQPAPGSNNPGVMSTNCVDWYYEIDYDVFVGKGSLANVNSYIQGVFNQVATLYNNDGVSITLQTLYVWTATDPYTGPSTSNYLNQFGAYRTSFAGDLANLVGYAGGGGVAYVNGLCGSTQYKMGYMGINSTYNTVPTYSWTVEVVTHEDGHLLGSRHTHDCVWNGNSTAIDGCGDAAGYNGSGTCATGPLPVSGTIMSYCHLVSGVGINFNNGFGPLPAALILNTVNTASCLSQCTACSTPAQPGTITGASTYCGTSSQTYSVAAVSGATSYTWTTPSGWTGTSTTNSITVTTTSTGGTISVTANNACGVSAARTLTITAGLSPSQPGVITGNSSACQGAVQIYTISAVSGATSYAWTLPSGWSGSSTGTSISATSGAAGGTISVAAINTCGTSSASSLTVSVNAIPAQPGTMTGSTSVCPATSQVYSVPLVSGASSYSWVLPAGWSGSSSTNSITVISSTTGGNISVTANNSCGTSPARSITISIGAAPAQPGIITATGGNTKVCPGSIKVYSITAVSGATSYIWTSPPGSTITGGQGTTSISVTFNSGFITSDSVKVSASNGCATSTNSFLIISRDTPARSGVISGAVNNVCNASNVPYTVTNVSGITYNWYFSNVNANVISGQGTNGVGANFLSAYTTGSLSVTATNACGTSSARSLTINAAPPQPGSMTGTTTPCAGQTGVPYSISAVTGATSYTWTVPSGARINDGNVTSTTTTLTTTASAVTVNFATTSGSVRVKANNACASGSNRTKNVSFVCRTIDPGISDPAEITIYPNPASNNIHVQFQSADGINSVINLIDIVGRTYNLHSDKSIEGMNDLNFDVRHLAPGIYFIELINGNDKSVSRIIIE